MYSVNNEDFTFKLTETINFNECAKPAQVYRVRHSGYYVNYNENELTTRFALESETQRAPGKNFWLFLAFLYILV